MSPDRKNDENDGRQVPPPERDGERPRAKAAKTGKTKATTRESDQSAAAETSARRDERDVTEQSRKREAGSSATADRPPRAAAKRPSTRSASSGANTSKMATPTIPVDPQDELPPHGDPLTAVEAEKPARAAKAKPRAAAKTPPAAALLPNGDELARLLAGEHSEPHAVLGAHALSAGGVSGVVIRTLMPNASAVEAVLADGQVIPLDVTVNGLANLYCGFVPGATLPLRYRLRFHFHDGALWERDDAYRFLPTVGDVDLHLFGEGTHRRLWEKLGAHLRTEDGVQGVSFAVWAPNAKRVSVVGDFCGWDGRIFPMRSMGTSGVFELFVPEIKPGALYKFEMLTGEGAIRVKTDPFAFKLEQSPGTASIVQAEGVYEWATPNGCNDGRRRDTGTCCTSRCSSTKYISGRGRAFRKKGTGRSAIARSHRVSPIT